MGNSSSSRVKKKKSEERKRDGEMLLTFEEEKFLSSVPLSRTQSLSGKSTLSAGRRVKVRAGEIESQICSEGVSVIWGSEKVPFHETVI